MPIQAIERAAAILRRAGRADAACGRRAVRAARPGKGTTHDLPSGAAGRGPRGRGSGPRAATSSGRACCWWRSYLNVSEARTIALCWTARLVPRHGEECRVAIPSRASRWASTTARPTGELLQTLEIGVGLRSRDRTRQVPPGLRGPSGSGLSPPLDAATPATTTSRGALRREPRRCCAESWAVERQELSRSASPASRRRCPPDGGEVAGAVLPDGPLPRLADAALRALAGPGDAGLRRRRAMSGTSARHRWPITPKATPARPERRRGAPTEVLLHSEPPPRREEWK